MTTNNTQVIRNLEREVDRLRAENDLLTSLLQKIIRQVAEGKPVNEEQPHDD